MGALVFKISGRRRRAGCGGFDSHAFPPCASPCVWTQRAPRVDHSFEQLDRHMEIPLFQTDESLHFERIILYPYPDLRRIWTRIWLTAIQGQAPNVELIVLNPDGSENTSVYMMAQRDQRIETTLHLRNPVPGAIYRVIANLTLGLSEHPEAVDRQEFDLALEFRDPEQHKPGFGIGVNWDELRQEGRQETRRTDRQEDEEN